MNLMQSGGADDFPGSQMPSRRRRIPLGYILLGLVLFGIGFFGATIWLNWTILEHMYSVKANLDWFSINFYGGLTFVVAAILALFFVNPQGKKSDLFEAGNALMGLQYRVNPYMSGGGYRGDGSPKRIRPMYIRPSWLLWGFWQLLKVVILFAIFATSNGFPLLGNITIVLDMATKGYGSWAAVGRVMSLPLFPASGQQLIGLIPTMEIQYQLISYFVTVLFVVIALRFFLKFVRDVVIRAGDKWIRNIFVSLAAIVAIVFINIPYWGMDVTIPYEFGAVGTVLLAFIILAVFFQVKATRETIPLAERRRAGVVAATLIIVALLVLNIGAFTFYRLNWNNNWIAYEWTPLTQKQITVTKWTAGIQNLTDSSIANLPTGNASKTLSLIRQWDSTSSLTQSKNRIGVNWLQTVDQPEIVYVYDHEYWAIPTTFNYPDASNWIATHLIYTHSSRIIMIDSHTGQVVNVTQAFRLPSQPLMYYGEDANASPGFSNDVYVGVQGSAGEIEGVSYLGINSDQPDYQLCGAQRSVWFLEQGQFGYALSPPQDCIDMLHLRNVFDRVQNVLISGLTEDSSTYLVTDSANGGSSLYFAIQVYIDYPLHTGFSAIPAGPAAGSQPYLRFFGVVLVNIQNGDMQGYTVAQPDGFLASFYKEYYPTWQAPPAWLQSQLRYPEQLLGNSQYTGQLDADFILHVNQSTAFRSGSDFFERPSNTQVLYIPYVIGNNVSFTAVQLVEFFQSSGKNLAGLYVTYGGDQLGQMYLYQANATISGGTQVPLLGPTAAITAFNTDNQTKTQETLTGAISGNILLYPVEGQLYYFIPAYIYQQSGSGSSVVTTNPFIDVISAQTSTPKVRFINTGSSQDLTYGFSGVTAVSNSTGRQTYIESLFKSQGLALQNISAAPNVVFVNYLGLGNYTNDLENQTATTFINHFINDYAKNSSVIGPGIAFNRMFSWIGDPGVMDYGFVVSDQGVTELYYISVQVGT